MSKYKVIEGRNIKIKGTAKKEIVDLALPKQAAIQPPDFKGLKPRVVVKVGDYVKVGSPIISDKVIEGLKIVSPVSGKITAVNRGDKRALIDIIIESDGNQEAESFQKFDKNSLGSISREDIIKTILNGGMWPCLRQRPFSQIARPTTSPKSIFIHAINTEPLALDVDFILNGQEERFQAGCDILSKLTDGKVHLCTAEGSTSKSLSSTKNVDIHTFHGPHPAGNVGTHIHYIDPIKKGDTVWYIEAQDVLRLADLFLNGVYPTERIVAITGEKATVKNRVYTKTIIGAPLSILLQGSDLTGARCISGSILNGREVGANGFVGFYDSQISIIPEGGNREFLGWLVPGFNKYTFTKTFASAFLPEKEASLDTDTNGAHRAIVLNHLYDELVPLDIMTYFLLKAIIAGDIEESERLGILECDEEDFTLCSFACPSKTDVSGIIRQGLAVIQKEG